MTLNTHGRGVGEVVRSQYRPEWRDGYSSSLGLRIRFCIFEWITRKNRDILFHKFRHLSVHSDNHLNMVCCKSIYSEYTPKDKQNISFTLFLKLLCYLLIIRGDYRNAILEIIQRGVGVYEIKGPSERPFLKYIAIFGNEIVGFINSVLTLSCLFVGAVACNSFAVPLRQPNAWVRVGQKFHFEDRLSCSSNLLFHVPAALRGQ